MGMGVYGVCVGVYGVCIVSVGVCGMWLVCVCGGVCVGMWVYVWVCVYGVCVWRVYRRVCGC